MAGAVGSNSRKVFWDPKDPCAICMDPMQKGIDLSTLDKCGHVFHRVCIKTWFQRQKICPLCKTSYEEAPVPQTQPVYGRSIERYQVPNLRVEAMGSLILGPFAPFGIYAPGNLFDDYANIGVPIFRF